MTVALREHDHKIATSARTVEIDGRSQASPELVFIDIAGGSAVAFDRAEFIQAIKAEFGLIDPLEELFNE
ncbi:hypothetical protein LQ938_09640 [Microbacterium sp. cx-55]|uniref:hypothetical protein n=1 Tax=Microbacterium sp. cx-55 TaxID=2875948 RepID=UPI001CC146F1|nr:hypothetical protein [Microbacterium sp. cx-55]MBZ4485976.1 hypothetical protein [Microbacterium sp. cx-55]UGB34150.1 hypothetical protein LQ938_09640 [Microbacterium sp. cx-55]